MSCTEPPESLSNLRKGTKVLGSIRRVRFTKATQRHANIRESKGPSVGQVQVKIHPSAQSYALKYGKQRLHCPGVSSKAKDTENCRFTIVPMRQRLRPFFALLFLSISSVSTEQLQTCVNNANPFTIDQGNLIWWWEFQLCSAKSRQKFLWRMMTQHIKTFYCSDMKAN